MWLESWTMWFESWIVWLESWKHQKFLKAFISFDSNHRLWVTRVTHNKSQFFKFFNIVWDFTSHVTWINLKYGSCSKNSTNWLKAYCSHSKQTFWFLHVEQDFIQNTYLKSIALNSKIYTKIITRGDSVTKAINDKR